MKINKEFYFKSSGKITENMRKIASTFNIPLTQQKTFKIFNNFDIKIPDTGIVYITGQSGSGKSVLLREIFKQYQKGILLDDICPKNESIIIDLLNLDFKKSLSWFSYLGLNEAFLMLRQYSHLSDGQKYRARLILGLAENNILFIDEFCSLLDRTTAKIISYNLQKIVAKHNKLIIAATAHDDLQVDLNPSVLVKCSLGEKAILKYDRT